MIFEITKLLSLLFFEFVSIPLSVEEVVLWICVHPSCVEVIVVEVLALCLSFLCRGDCWSLALCLACCVDVVAIFH